MIGRKLAHYRIQEHLGGGGMGEVYLARDEHLDRQVAVKVLPEPFASDEKRVARFHRESKLASQLSHPNIAAIYDSGEHEGCHYIAMELIRGKTLVALVRPGGMPLEEVLDLALPLADGLAEAHAQGVLHRDLKPGNVMVDERGRVKILDFGLSRRLTGTEVTSEGLTSSGKILGTPHYMSPEQVHGREMDERSDLFSVGVILYELACGVRPFDADSLAGVLTAVTERQPTPILQVKPQLGELFAHLVHRLLEKAPDRRVQHASDLVAELRSLKASLSTTGVVRRRSRLELGTWVGGSLVLCLGVLYFLDRDRTKGADVGPPSARPVLAIVPFLAPEGDPDANRIALTLVHSLPETLDVPEIDLLTARFLGDRAKRRGIQAGALDSHTGRELAEEAGATILLVGQVERGPNGLDLYCELLDTKNGVHRASKNIFSAEPERVRDYVEELTRAFLPALGVPQRPDEHTLLLSDSHQALEAWARGLVAYDAGNWTEAELYFSKAVSIDPAFALAHFHRARALMWLAEGQDHARGLRSIEEALRLSDRLSTRDREKTELFAEYFRGNGVPKAPGLVEKARNLAQQDATDKEALDLWMELAAHHEAERDFSEMIQACERLIELDPEYVPAYLHLFELPDEGVYEPIRLNAARVLLDRSPASAAKLRAAIVLRRTDEIGKLVHDPSWERSLGDRRASLFGATVLGEFELAEQLADSSGPSGALPGPLKVDVYTALLALGRFESVREGVETSNAYPIQRLEVGIIPPAPIDLESSLCRVVALARKGKIDEAEELLAALGEHDPAVRPAVRRTGPLTTWARAEVEHQRGRRDGATALFLQAAHESKEGVFARFLSVRAAQALVEVGRLGEAEDLLRLLDDVPSAAEFGYPEWWVVPRIRSRWIRALCSEARGDAQGALAQLEVFLEHWHEPDVSFPEIEQALEMYEFLAGEPYRPRDR